MVVALLADATRLRAVERELDDLIPDHQGLRPGLGQALAFVPELPGLLRVQQEAEGEAVQESTVTHSDSVFGLVETLTDRGRSRKQAWLKRIQRRHAWWALRRELHALAECQDCRRVLSVEFLRF